MPKPLVLLIDGYNVIGPVAPPNQTGRVNAGLAKTDAMPLARPIAGRGPDSRRSSSDAASMWLHRERVGLLDRLADSLSPEIRARTCVVFDAANPPVGRPDRLEHRLIQVCFSVGYREADEMIEELIRAHHSPKQLTVVSSDHRVQAAARRRKATAYDSEAWFDDVLDGHAALVYRPKVRKSKSRASTQESSGGAIDGDPPVALPTESEIQAELDDLDPDSVARWMKEFGLEQDQTPKPD